MQLISFYFVDSFARSRNFRQNNFYCHSARDFRLRTAMRTDARKEKQIEVAKRRRRGRRARAAPQ